MNKLLFLLIACSFSFSTSANKHLDSIPPIPNDVGSADKIIAALYDVISGEAGVKRNWDRMRTLFIPEGRLTATGQRPDGSRLKRSMSVEDYINTSGPYLEKNGFFESEIGRSSHAYGNIMQVFSTYASKQNLQMQLLLCAVLIVFNCGMMERDGGL